MTSKSYGAHVDFIFNRQDIEGIMNNCGLKYASVSPGDVLLIPILIDKNKSKIINDELDDEFFSAINALPDQFGLLKIKKVLNNSLIEMIEFDSELVRSNDYEDFEQLLKNHGCSSVLVLIIKPYSNESITFEVKMINKNDKYHDKFNYKISKNEQKQIIIKKLIGETLKNVDLVWKRGFESNNKTVFNSVVSIEMSDQKEWKKICGIINQVSIIKQYKFKKISENNIELELKYIGSPQDLSAKLLENGIAVFKKHDKTIMKLLQEKI
jgi:hypothetical protein